MTEPRWVWLVGRVCMYCTTTYFYTPFLSHTLGINTVNELSEDIMPSPKRTYVHTLDQTYIYIHTHTPAHRQTQRHKHTHTHTAHRHTGTYTHHKQTHTHKFRCTCVVKDITDDSHVLQVMVHW